MRNLSSGPATKLMLKDLLTDPHKKEEHTMAFSAPAQLTPVNKNNLATLLSKIGLNGISITKCHIVIDMTDGRDTESLEIVLDPNDASIGQMINKQLVVVGTIEDVLEPDKTDKKVDEQLFHKLFNLSVFKQRFKRS